MFMRFRCLTGIFLYLLTAMVAAKEISLNEHVHVHCPEQFQTHNSQDQLSSYIEEYFFDGPLVAYLLNQKHIWYQYSFPRPGIYVSVGGVLAFFHSGRAGVRSLKCEYLGPGGVYGAALIHINDSYPFDVISRPYISKSKPRDCLPVDESSYGGVEYIPCALEAGFSLIASKGVKLYVVEQQTSGKYSGASGFSFVAENTAAFYLYALTGEGRKNITFLCTDPAYPDLPLHIASGESSFYKLVAEPRGGAWYLTCYRNGKKLNAVPWGGRGNSDENNKKQEKPRGDRSYKNSNYQRDQEWQQSDRDNHRQYDEKSNIIFLQQFLKSQIIYALSWFGLGEIAYYFIGGSPLEEAYVELGVPMHSTNLVVIKKRCRELKKEYHPDKGGGEEQFIFVSEMCELVQSAIK